jgi:uncharacterized protein YjiS (DUF1127 family)
MFAPSTTPIRSARRPFAIARGVRVAAFAVANWTASIVRGYLNRRTALEMMHFDERMLKDIGLTRGDVHASIIEPMGADPTVRMRILAVERRAATKAQAAERLAGLRAEEAARGEAAARGVERRRLRIVGEDCAA